LGAAFDACVQRLQAQPKTWLVTGAAGFIGSHLTRALLAIGQRVVGFDNFATGKRENLTLVERELGAERFAGFRLIEADVRDFDTCRAACAGVDYVLHQAALGSVPRSIARPIDTHEANVSGTLNVFMAALEQRVSRVVYASSSSVYGDDPALPKVETRIGRPLSPYAASKHMGEVYASVLGLTHGFSAIGLRYFNVVGPRQDPDGPYAAVVPRWLAELARGQRPLIFGDGETSRDFCPVPNVVQANLLAALGPAELAGRVYNIALGSRTTLNELAAILLEGMARRGFPCADLSPEHREFRAGDVRHSLADIAAAQRDLGYEPDCSLSDGLALVMDSFAAARDRA
jgi:UDP-N-acetylglucosamine/UDP-N-acetylgalactosamine 4-epimerase